MIHKFLPGPSDEYAKEAIEPLISPLILSGESEENGSAPLQEEQMEIVTPEWAIRRKYFVLSSMWMTS